MFLVSIHLQVERLEEALHELNYEYKNVQNKEDNLSETVSIDEACAMIVSVKDYS